MQNVHSSLLIGRITEFISPTTNHIWTFIDIIQHVKVAEIS